MTWFRRGGAHPAPAAPPTPAAQPPDEDDPATLLRGLYELVVFINANAGRLPTGAVVLARQITDTVHAVIGTSDGRALDIHAVIAVRGIIADYLPTTLRSYLALDPDQHDRPQGNGRTPNAALIDQLESLWEAADDLLSAAQARDADALMSQGNFLRAKFTRSDLDL